MGEDLLKMFDYGGTTGLSSLIAKNHPHPTARDESGAMQSGPYRGGNGAPLKKIDRVLRSSLPMLKGKTHYCARRPIDGGARRHQRNKLRNYERVSLPG